MSHSDDWQATAEARFKNISQKPHLPAAMLAIVGKVMELEAKASSKVQPVDIESIKNKLCPPESMAQGAPLMLRENFVIDRTVGVELAEELLSALPELVQATDQSLAESALCLQKMLKDKELNWNDAFDALLKDDQNFFKLWAAKLEKAPALVRFLTCSGAAPSLRLLELELRKHLPQNEGKEPIWGHGHCPICGSLPFIGRLLKKEGQRFHCCSFCRHEYRVKRLQCPFCLNENGEKLHFYTADEEPLYQLHVCNECKNYVKLADYRQAAQDYVAALDDLDSITIDILARRMGYTRPTLSAWGF